MSIYSQFETNRDLEKQGFALEILDNDGDKTTFILARSGGANKAFANALKKAMRPYARMQEGDALEKISTEATIKAMSEHVVLAWDNVKGRDGEVIEFTPEACQKLLTDLPELAEFLLREANAVSNFLVEERIEAGKS